MNKKSVRVLLVEDDEDDYVLFRDVISEIKYFHIDLTWINDCQHILHAAERNMHDIYIVDYLLGGCTGIDILNTLKENGIRKPVIILTGHSDHDIDVQAMEEGAADYLEKETITPQLLERVIRYSLQKSEAMEMMRESENRLRQLSMQLINTQEDERKRIAKELHDSIGSNLAAVKFEIQKQIADSKKRRSSIDIDHQFTYLMDIVHQTIEETRRICHNLRPPVLDDLGIVLAINWYCRNFLKAYSNITIDTDIGITEAEIPEHVKVVIFRVIQEAFTNVTKHSGADKVELIFEKSDDKIILVIRDNGSGFDVNGEMSQKDHSGGMGLLSMNERVSYSGGILLLCSEKGKGTEIRASWPVPVNKD